MIKSNKLTKYLPEFFAGIGAGTLVAAINSGRRAYNIKPLLNTSVTKEPTVDPKRELRKSYIRKSSREPITYISRVEDLPHREHLKKRHLKSILDAVKGKNSAQLFITNGKRRNYIVGPPRINKNVLLHEVGHTLQRRSDELRGLEKMKRKATEVFKPSVEEREAWRFVGKHSKLTPDDRAALNSYLRNEEINKALIKGILGGSLLSGAILSKTAGILDRPKESLPKDVWIKKGGSLHLRREIRDQIINTIRKFLPDEDIKEVVVIGSITGYKYTSTSDIDVNVLVRPYYNRYHSIRRRYNGESAGNTAHPINYMVEEMPEDRGRNPWKDSFFGVYDVLGDKWLSHSPPKSYYRKPGNEYNIQLKVARHIARNFERLLKAFREDLKELVDIKKSRRSDYDFPFIKHRKIVRKERELKEDIMEVLTLVNQIEDKRKFSYRYGFGIPRKSFNNILYKLLENGPFGHEFHLLQKIKIDPLFGE